MIDHLYSKNCYEQITGEKPTKMTDKHWAKLDRKMIACLRQWVDENIYHHVQEMLTSKAIWVKHQEIYERSTYSNRKIQRWY